MHQNGLVGDSRFVLPRSPSVQDVAMACAFVFATTSTAGISGCAVDAARARIAPLTSATNWPAY